MTDTGVFIAGMATMGFIFAGLFFFRFWGRTRDGLFAAFGIAFWLLALNQAAIALAGVPREELSWVYILRVAAFLLIIAAILRKNLPGRGSKSP